MPGRLAPSLLRGTAVPDDVAGHALLDHEHALLGDALEVERLRIAARVEPVVPEREAVVEELLAEATGQVAAALEEGERVERGEAEVEEELRDRVGLEHRAIGRRLDLLGGLRAGRLLGRLAGDGGRVDLRRAPGGRLGVAGDVLARREREDADVGDRLRDRVPGRRGDADLGGPARVVAVEPEVGGGVDRRGGLLGLVLRGLGGRLLVEALHRGHGRRWLEAREARVDRRAVGGLAGAPGDRGEAVLVGPVRRRAPDAAVAHDPER